MIRLDLLDPTDPQDPRFDPGGDQARRVRAAAVARAQARPTPQRPRLTRRSLALVAGAAAALAVAAVLVSTTGSPSDARAVLRDAARRTAAVESGRVIWSVRASARKPRGGPFRDEYREEIRFDGDDLAAVARSRWVDGNRSGSTRTTYVEVDRVGYTRDDSKPNAPFEREPFQSSGQDPTHLIVKQVGSPALVELARRSDDLTTKEGPDGSVTYRATATAGAVFDAAPRAAGRAKGPSFARPVRLEITVDGDGLIRRVRTTSQIEKTDTGYRDLSETTVTEYLDLGEPQRIEAPPNPAESDIEPPPELCKPDARHEACDD
jgi:hypothetical protein